MWACPAWIEDALWDAAPAVDRGALVDAIRRRSIAYTRERERLGELRGDADLAARAVFFGVADAAKPMVPLAELGGRGLIPAREPLRVLDVGAGTGAMTLGAAAALGRPLEVTAVDRDAGALRLFDAAFRAVPDSRLAVVHAELRSPSLPTSSSSHGAAEGRGRRAQPAGVRRPEGYAQQCPDPDTRGARSRSAEGRWGGEPFDLILAGTVFNEILPEHHVPLARELIASLAPDGALVIIEPALRDTARALHRLRDALLEAGDAHVFAPCVRRGTPCPMLADESDWCHEDRPTRLPPRAQALATATGLRDRGLKFAYLVLRRDAAPQVEPPGPGRRALRVVSQVHRPKGKIELYGCGDGGRSKVRLLRRHRSPANRPFERAGRGDVLVLSPDDELTADDRVERIETRR